MNFNEIYLEISRINKKDVVSAEARLGKLTEELGEFAKAINKTNGRKILKEGENSETIREELIDEAADTVQNVISIIDGFNITVEELLSAMEKKNKVWENKINKVKK